MLPIYQRQFQRPLTQLCGFLAKFYSSPGDHAANPSAFLKDNDAVLQEVTLNQSKEDWIKDA